MAGVKRTGVATTSTGASTSFDLSTGIDGVIANPDVGSIPTSRDINPTEHVRQNSLDMLFGGSNLNKQIDRMLAPMIQNRAILQAEVFPRYYLAALQYLIKEEKDSEDEQSERRAADLEELYKEFRSNRKLYKMLSGLLIAG